VVGEVFLGQAHVFHRHDPLVGQVLDSVNQVEFHAFSPRRGAIARRSETKSCNGGVGGKQARRK
jgi:hypothetical protein